MQKVVGINLNGRAYHVEEPGYDALVAYLDRAAARLADNPDRAEILADLEQAIAEKCDRLLGPHTTVVAAAEIDRILAEMGPVDAGDGEDAAPAGGAARTSPKDAAASPKRLYQIRDGAMISGLCVGLAAYLNIDVTIVRVAFVLLAIVTKGAWLLVYAVLMFVIPYAETSEERAAARGEPFNAKAVIDHAVRQLESLKNNKDLKRHWRRQQRQLRRQLRRTAAPYAWNARASYASQVWASATAPVFGLINAVLALAFVYTLFSLTTTHSAFGVRLPDNVPLWAGIVIVFGLYQFVASPLVAMHRLATQPHTPGLLVWMSPVANLAWLAVIGASAWYGYTHVPAVHDSINTVINTLRETAGDLQGK